MNLRVDGKSDRLDGSLFGTRAVEVDEVGNAGHADL